MASPLHAHEVLGASAIRAQHSRLILNLLWGEHEISRADLARRTGLSRSTVSAIVHDLLETGLVKEARAGKSSGGRKPIILQFQDQACCTLGVELGATHISCVLTDLRCKILASWSKPVPVRDQPKVALEAMVEGLKAVQQEAGFTTEQAVGIGVAVPSPVDRERPGELLPLVVPKWEGYNIIESMQKHFDLPVFVDNDANLGALGELWWGIGTDAKDIAYIKVATGIGAGLIVEGRIFRGSSCIAGEIGHTAIDVDGPECICGLNGCLTTIIGTPALLARAKDKLQDAGSSLPPPANIDELVDLALAGDETAIELVKYAGGQLGIGVANLLNLLNPKAVVLGGGIVRAGDLLLDTVRKTINGLSLADSISNADIRPTALNEWGIAVGASTLVLETALESPALFPLQVKGAA